MWNIGDKLRFKTMKEFENEFGSNWRSKTGASFPRNMDYLFNAEFTVNSMMGRWYNSKEGHERSYSISTEMLTHRRDL